jgi:plastocyanin
MTTCKSPRSDAVGSLPRVLVRPVRQVIELDWLIAQTVGRTDQALLPPSPVKTNPSGFRLRTLRQIPGQREGDMRARGIVTSLTVLVLATTVACGGGGEPEAATPSQGTSTSSAPSSTPTPSSESADPTEEPAEKVVITISDFAFQVPETVPPGAEVTVVNEDGSYHTVTADDGTFDVGARQGEPVTFTAPEQPGQYPFHCTPHPSITAILVVA